MAVYVDDMHKHPMGRFGRMTMCHMIADTSGELLAMADAIGVARRWIQNAGRPDEHFDIAVSKRARAVFLGATEITMRDCAKMTKSRRRGVTHLQPGRSQKQLTLTLEN